MLQLIQIKENEIDVFSTEKNLSSTFILTFLDEQLPEQLWPIVESELRNYQPQENGAEVRAEAVIRETCNYINLNIVFPLDLNMSEEDIDNALEKFKDEFEEHYEKLIERIQLIPAFT